MRIPCIKFDLHRGARSGGMMKNPEDVIVS